MEDKTKDQAQILDNRLQKRFRHLKKWAQRTGAGAFRLYDKDIPEIPLVLDFYGDCNAVDDAALSGALYKRPYEKDENEEELWLSAMKESASDALGIPFDRIFLKQRQRQRGDSQYEKISHTNFEKIISEGGLSFKVNLSDYLDTGLFLDRRLLRNLIRTEFSSVTSTAGKKMLNLFSYTSSFSVYAASSGTYNEARKGEASGSVSTDSVDLSNTYLNWSRENFSLNGMSSSLLRQWEFFSDKDREEASANRLIRADVLEFIEKAVQAKMKWDLIVLDPPVFSNSKKMIDYFDLNRDLTKLLSQCIELLSPDGKIFVSINVKRNAPSAQELENELRAERVYNHADIHVTDIDNIIKDEDFKDRKMPKTFLIKEK